MTQNNIPTARIKRRSYTQRRTTLIRVPLFLAFGDFNSGRDDSSHARLRQTYEAAQRVQLALSVTNNPKKTLIAVMAAVSGLV